LRAKKGDEQVGKFVFPVKRFHHGFFFDAQNRAIRFTAFPDRVNPKKRNPPCAFFDALKSGKALIKGNCVLARTK
jgi:hypothetical protein